jgi:signal transduction histidine kinase/CheY-like chemotaxis protein
MATFDADSERVLIFAPIGRDGPAAADMLRRSGLRADVCATLNDLLDCIKTGLAVALVAEEGLHGQGLSVLSRWIERQPPWSDLPFIILTSHLDQPAVAAWRKRAVTALRNVSFLERPVQTITLTSAVQAGLRGRMRQYELRALLQAKERSTLDLEHLVVARTRELKDANTELMKQMAERARVEESLRQAQKIEAIGQLTGGVAHDFNNLLMVILGGLDMLGRQADPTRRKLLMDGMRQAAERGAALTRQLLAFSRRQALQPQPLNLALLVEGMRELLDRSLRADINVELEFADDLWTIEVDPAELNFVVINLAVNARDAMPSGGTITIRADNVPAVHECDLHGDYVRLAISDSGTGMSLEVQEHVFEPFFTTKEVGKGSGLGLAQVYGFAKQSGGTVRIESEVGRGTSVIVFLPRSAKQPLIDPPHLATLHVKHKRTKSASVLLVEDNDEVAALVTEMLDELGYEVTRVASAAAALGALADQRAVDMVFSDIMMPGGMDGLELAREIRTRRPSLPVLLTSGYVEALKRGAEVDTYSVLRKPYRLDELATALENAATECKRDAIRQLHH